MKLHDPDDETCTTPSKDVDVMRQTHTSIDNVSENHVNGLWTEAKDVNLSEEWTGTARSHILRARLSEGYMWVNGRPSKITDHQTRQLLASSLDMIFVRHKKKNKLQNGQKKSAKLQTARRKREIYEVLTEDKDYFKVIADARLKLE